MKGGEKNTHMKHRLLLKSVSEAYSERFRKDSRFRITNGDIKGEFALTENYNSANITQQEQEPFQSLNLLSIEYINGLSLPVDLITASSQDTKHFSYEKDRTLKSSSWHNLHQRVNLKKKNRYLVQSESGKMQKIQMKNKNRVPDSSGVWAVPQFKIRK